MEKQTIDKINIMQAYVDGKEIEYLNMMNEWVVIKNPSWDWDGIDYRIKPEPITIPLDFKNDQKRFYNAIIKPKDNSFDVILSPTSINEKGITVVHYETFSYGVYFITYQELYDNYEIWNNLMNRWDDCSKIK
jgi:hypothetical protein